MDVWVIPIVLVASLIVATPLVLVLAGWALRRLGVLPTPSGVGAGNGAAPTLPAVRALTEDQVVELRADLTAVRAEWSTYRKQLDAYLEAFEDIEETVERKRRRAVTARSKATAAQEAPEEPTNPREAARMRARMLGFKV